MQCPVCRSASLGGGTIAGIVVGGLAAVSVPVVVIGKATASLHCAEHCLAAEGASELIKSFSGPYPEARLVAPLLLLCCLCRVACRLVGMPN